jgi:VWFA-related protein
MTRFQARVLVLTVGVALAGAVFPSARQQGPAATFRAGRDLVSIDVVVRDRNGTVVRGLTADDFEVREEGRTQEILTFTFEQIDERAPAARQTELLAGVEAQVAAGDRPGAEPVAVPLQSDDVAGRRLTLLLFDVSSMQPEDVQRAVDAAQRYVQEQMSPADLIAVATVGTALDVLTDFTGERETVEAALARLAITEGTAMPLAQAATLAVDEAALAEAAAAASAESTEFDTFNNDTRLRALRIVAETLAPIEQKKAIVYFSAGMERSGQDNQVELRAATNAAVRANVAIYPVDTRGLEAIVPGGDASQASRGGVGLFSGRNVAQQFERLGASQDTLVSLAEDTGGRAFTDSNDFGDVFVQIRRDLSAYYLLGYSSTNDTQDGRFRRVQVRVKRDGLRVEARNGYYAARDFAHTNRGDREAQLQEQLAAAVSSTDLPVLVTSGYFRLRADRYYVPIAVAIPGSAIPAGAERAAIDVLGQVRDEQGRAIGRMRETLQVPAAGGTVGNRQVLYQSGVTLPPGRFSIKVVVRENTSGTVGSFEARMLVPELRQAPLKVSSVVLSTQLQPWERGRTDNPLVRDGVQLLPNLTRVVGRSQPIYVYYEVYEPASGDGATPMLRTSLAFYRNDVKVFETPVVERTEISAPDRQAALFQFELPSDTLSPGLYTCQVTIVDAVAGRFSFPRLTLLVR